jgi:bifunctional UDP-N-acetylglucosamine pyrophosphorylase/glucosamine-1-phosphate N-acetyltransferase
VIGANAVVLRDVPPHCVVCGVPARIVKHLTPSRCPSDAERQSIECDAGRMIS